MKEHKDVKNPTSDPTDAEVENAGMNEEELDEVSGGIIIVSGKKTLYKANSRYSPVALNPQPLPPKIFNIGPGH